MFGDTPLTEQIAYLEQNELGLKFSDKNVHIAFIRPMHSFDLTCKYQHWCANHILNRVLIRRNFVDDLGGVFNYDSWAASKNGAQLLALDAERRAFDGV